VLALCIIQALLTINDRAPASEIDNRYRGQGNQHKSMDDHSGLNVARPTLSRGRVRVESSGGSNDAQDERDKDG